MKPAESHPISILLNSIIIEWHLFGRSAIWQWKRQTG